MSCSTGHFQWLFDLQEDLAKTQSISVVVPSYTLAPHGQYPNQLKEAAECLTWLLQTRKKKASNLIVGGDSAGGNMTLMLLSHLIHPHPEVQPINLSEPLAGALLISPWTKFATDDDSVKRNALSDIVTPQAADRWSSLFLGELTTGYCLHLPLLKLACRFKPNRQLQSAYLGRCDMVQGARSQSEEYPRLGWGRGDSY